MWHEGRVLDATIVDVNAIHRLKVFDDQGPFTVECKLAVFAADRIMLEAEVGIRVASYNSGWGEIPLFLSYTIDVILQNEFVKHDARCALEERVR